jgi:hypothetical protein
MPTRKWVWNAEMKQLIAVVVVSRLVFFGTRTISEDREAWIVIRTKHTGTANSKKYTALGIVNSKSLPLYHRFLTSIAHNAPEGRISQGTMGNTRRTDQ